MIPVVFPRSLNWFYEAQAASLADDLVVSGTAAQAVASKSLAARGDPEADTILIISFAETLVAADRAGAAAGYLRCLGKFRRRILVNFDALQSPWFAKHFSQGADYFTDIFDVGLYRQTSAALVHGSRYVFVPEAFSAAGRDAIRSWSAGRPVPWAMLGHATRERSALIEATMRALPKHGFVFNPPLRPFTNSSSLDGATLGRVLGQSDLYIWGSHHHHPYHETQRVLHAVAAGAVPVKVDPLHSRRMRLPWVYPSLQAMVDARDRDGLQALYDAARCFVEAQGTIGGNVTSALQGRDEPGPRRPVPQTAP